MNSVIWISVIGAGLVILGLVILWFMMDALVRITGSKKPSSGIDKTNSATETTQNIENMQKAAAASTAVAIALLKASFLSSDQEIDQCVTAWQGAHRHSQLHNQPHKTKLNRNDK